MKNIIIQNLLDQYNIPETSPVKLLRESGDNEVFLVGKHDKRILRLSKRLPKRDVQFEFDTISHLHKNKIPVPSWIRTVNNSIFSSSGKSGIAVLFDYIKGYHANVNNNMIPNSEQARSAGRTLGLMSVAGKSFRPTTSRNRNIYSELERVLKHKYLFINHFQDGEIFVGEVRQIKNFSKRAKSSVGVIHNDFRPSNVYFKNDKEISGIIDFDWCCMGPAIKDLALGVLEWSFPDGEMEPNFRIFDAFLEGYNSSGATKVVRGPELYSWIQFAALSDTATYFCDRLNSPELKKQITSSFMYRKYLYFNSSTRKL